MVKAPTKPTAQRAVRVWLAEHDKTQVWLAVEAGLHQSAVSDMLRGIRPLSDRFVTSVKKITGIDLTQFERVA